MKNKILVIFSQKIMTLDNFNEGEDPDTSKCCDISHVEGMYNDLEDFAEKNDLPIPTDDWYTYKDGIIEFSRMENSYGEKALPFELEKFQKGEIDLWAATYTFWIQLIEGVYTPSIKEIHEKFNLRIEG